jgi:hypothetical protein
MRAALMRSATALSLVLVSVSACSGSGGEQASAALKKYFRADMEDFATKGAWVNRDYQFEDDSSTISAAMTADVITTSGANYGSVKVICNYKLTDTSWALVNGSYYENDSFVTDQAPCGGPFPRE